MVAVSVVIPCYNRELYIANAIRSVLDQSFSDFEIVVVDDGSRDKSVEIIRSIESSKIRLIELKTNNGISAARNAGIAASRGEFIAFLDSDDQMHPNRLEIQVGHLNADKRNVICGSNLKRIDQRGELLGTVDHFSEDDKIIKFNSILVCPFHFATTMVRAHSQNGTKDIFNESYEVGEDYDYMRRKLIQGKATLSKECLTYCREHNSSKSKEFFQNNKDRYYEIFSEISLKAAKEIGFNTDAYTLSILRDKIHSSKKSQYNSLSQEDKEKYKLIEELFVERFLRWYDDLYKL